MWRLLYNLVLLLVAPVVPLRLWWRARRDPAYAQHWRERLGSYAAPPSSGAIWIHAVSVGEVRAAAPLVAALRRRKPERPLLVTVMTPTGRATAQGLFGEGALVVYAPYDFSFAVRRFLRHFRPQAALLMETELWPNLVWEARRADVPVCLINARLSERSARRYRRVAPLVARVLGALSAVAAQSEGDAERLAALGARAIRVTGNLKFDVVPPDDAIAQGRALRTRLGPRPVVIAASTREGEEALLLTALAALPEDILLLIVPRHPERFDEVARLLSASGVPFARKSTFSPPDGDIRVLLGDSLGEMYTYYASADVAIMGGTFLPYGGQNLIEPCALGVPVIVGPHTYNFAEAARLAVAAGATLAVPDAAAALAAAGRLCRDETARMAMSEKARAFAEAHRGATGRTLAYLAESGCV